MADQIIAIKPHGPLLRRPHQIRGINRLSRQGVPALWLDMGQGRVEDMRGQTPRGTLTGCSFKGMSIGGLGVKTGGSHGTNFAEIDACSALNFYTRDGGSYTIDCWFKADQFTSYNALCALSADFSNGNAENRICTVYLDPGTIYFGVGSYTANPISNNSAGGPTGNQPFVTGRPQHLALVWHNYGGPYKWEMYVNGFLYQQGNANAHVTYPTTGAALRIGCGDDQGGDDFYGEIACWRQWNHAKTPVQVKALYDAETRWDLYDTRKPLMFNIPSAVNGLLLRRMMSEGLFAGSGGSL